VIGHTLPRGSRVAAAILGGRRHGAHARVDHRGLEVTVKTGAGTTSSWSRRA